MKYHKYRVETVQEIHVDRERKPIRLLAGSDISIPPLLDRRS